MASPEAHRRAQLWLESLTDERLLAMARGIRVPDELAFIQSLQIEDKLSGGLIPFLLWDCQKDLVARLDGESRLFALKARQLGITWTVLAHLLYLGSYWGNRLFLIASQSGDDAAAALQRLRLLQDSIPAELHPQKLIKDNTRQLVFANGSRYESIKATKRSGRSKSAYATLADEVAFWEWPAEQLSALDAASERLYVVTTGNGPDGLLDVIWRQAQERVGRWQAVFYAWSAHPGRAADPQWYRLNVEEAAEPRLARREYASTPEEAFASPRGVFFQRFDSQVNVVDFGATNNWKTWRAVDFGFHWPICLWLQEAPSGQVVVVAELGGRQQSNLTTEEFAAAIHAKDAELGLVAPPRATFCDPAGRGVNPQTGESEVEVFRAQALAPVSVISSVRDGCVRIMDALAEPTIPLLVSQQCPWLSEALGAVSPDRQHPDVYDEHSVYDHALDALRYYFVNRPRIRSEFHMPDYSGQALYAHMLW